MYWFISGIIFDEQNQLVIHFIDEGNVLYWKIVEEEEKEQYEGLCVYESYTDGEIRVSKNSFIFSKSMYPTMDILLQFLIGKFNSIDDRRGD